jgi:DNA-binding MarR family transcriptional regulator
MHQIEIEQRLLIAQHNVSRLIDRLETEGLVRRESCSADGRGQIVRIKPAGRSLLKRMWPVYGERFNAPSATG